MEIYSQITFFYYEDYKAACEFYENIFNFKVVQDQKMAKIYQIGKSFFGIVDGDKGSLRPQPDKCCHVDHHC
jgi:predicted enzyme related to lactoylglutathione lyase